MFNATKNKAKKLIRYKASKEQRDKEAKRQCYNAAKSKVIN